MFEELKKSIDKGLDYAFMTTDKLAKAAKEMAKENNLTKEEAKKLLDLLVKKSEETRKTLEDNFGSRSWKERRKHRPQRLNRKLLKKYELSRCKM